MAKPTGALEVVNGYTYIDLEILDDYDSEGGTVYPTMYRYVITRVPQAIPELTQGGMEQFCYPEYLIGTSGVDDIRVGYTYTDWHGSRKSSAGATLDVADPNFLKGVSASDYPFYPVMDAARYVVVEVAMKHANITVTQGDLLVNGLWMKWAVKDDDPVAVDRLETYPTSKSSDAEFLPNCHASAWDMMSGFALSLNTLTYMNCGGFGTGCLSVPFYGFPEEVA